MTKKFNLFEVNKHLILKSNIAVEHSRAREIWEVVTGLVAADEIPDKEKTQDVILALEGAFSAMSGITFELIPVFVA